MLFLWHVQGGDLPGPQIQEHCRNEDLVRSFERFGPSCYLLLRGGHFQPTHNSEFAVAGIRLQPSSEL